MFLALSSHHRTCGFAKKLLALSFASSAPTSLLIHSLGIESPSSSSLGFASLALNIIIMSSAPSSAKPSNTGAKRGRPRKYGTNKQQQQQKAAAAAAALAVAPATKSTPGTVGNNDTPSNSNKDQQQQNETSLVRDISQGMAPRGILTGYYTSQGTRVRHTVHDGALKLPRDAIDLMEQVTEEATASLISTTVSGDGNDGDGSELIDLPTKYELPGLDSVIRPCLDPKLTKITVTELCATTTKVAASTQPSTLLPSSLSQQGSDQSQQQKSEEETNRAVVNIDSDDNTNGDVEKTLEDGQSESNVVVNVMRTRAENRIIDRPWLLRRNIDEGWNDPSTSRIRGGGGDGGDSGTTNEIPPTANTAGSAAAAFVQGRQVSQQAAPPSNSPQIYQQQVPIPGGAVTSNSVAVDTPMPDAPSRGVASLQSQQAQPQQQLQQPSNSLSTLHPPSTGQTMATISSPAPSAAMSTPSTTLVPSATTVGSGIPSTTAPSAFVSSDTTTAAVSSATDSASAAQAKVETLKKRPAPQWEQFKPGPNDETITPAELLTPKPSWYHPDRISTLERTMLPEWFNGSSSHRTPNTYVKTRERMIQISTELANRNLTNAIIRRSIVGDVGSLHRLRSFLVEWGLINEDGINDSAPTPATLREELASTSASNKKQKRGEVGADGQAMAADGSSIFNAQLRNLLLRIVVQQSKEISSSGGPITIDWDHIAAQIGHGATASDCEREFLIMPLNGANVSNSDSSNMAAGALPSNSAPLSTTSAHVAVKSNGDDDDDASGMVMEELRQKVFLDLVRESHPAVVSAVVQSALQATESNLPEAQKAALIGLVSSRALGQARSQEAALSLTLSELVSQRMQKLENRMALMDDIEGMLEAERVALELERRDLYTARCRHWFGGS